MAPGLASMPSQETTPQFHYFDSAPGLAARPFRVVCIGAGLVGIHFASRFREFTNGIDLVIYEKNSTCGGTWVNNIYPGVACDVPSHAYTFPEHPYHNWSNFQAPGADCAQYAQFLAKKCHLDDYTRYNVTIDRCTWNDKKGVWVVEGRDTKTGESIRDEANALINSTGFLSQPKYPNKESIKEFKGPVLHTAEWDPKTDFKGKKMALVGIGSSGMQTLSKLQAQAKHVDVYVKSETYIVPPFAGIERDRFFGFTDGLKAGMISEDPARINPAYTQEQKDRFEKDPVYLQQHRKQVLAELNGAYNKGVTRKGSAVGQDFKTMVHEMTNLKLANRPDLKRYFLPNWTPGCRRPTPAIGFFDAIQADNVNFIPARVEAATASGLIDEHGVERDYDILVYATGFHVDFRTPFEIIGLNGCNTQKPEFYEKPESYLVMHFPNLPNYYTPNGVFVPALNGELLGAMAKMGDHIMKCILKLQRYRYKSMRVKPEVVDSWMQYGDAYLRESIFHEPCSGWYKGNSEGEKKLRTIWPGTMLHCLELMQDPPWEDFIFERLDGEEEGPAQFNYMGNGIGRREQETKDFSWYVPLVPDIYKETPKYGDADARWQLP